MKEAMLYEKIEDRKVRCNLCNHRCIILPSKRGICGVRENQEGALYTLVYEKVVAANIDPIEKKPFFNFYPGTRSYSIATAGCNFRCLHCQNYNISQMPKDHDGMITGEVVKAEEIVAMAEKTKCRSISYTYTEPTIFFEYAYDTAVLASKKGIKNVFVTNGYMTKEALTLIKPYLDAANVDLKFFDEKTHQKICGAKRNPVLETIKLMRELGIWVEVTTLIIPTLNDSDEELRQIAQFVYSVGPEIPWHVSAFYPTYKLTDLPSTPSATLKKARKIGFDAGLRYVYTGNIPGDEGEDTFCYNCKTLLIDRHGYEILKYNIKEGRCPKCQTLVDGKGMEEFKL
ncbi:MAG: AmmeMemoRadiSam system radical SAM enzyme [Nitrospirae bacterium]|nr:AmmeMemoRadiSam system radical SAM enzyme [Nitrospirota bacterium]